MKQKFNKTGKSLLAFLLAAVMVFAMIPAVAVHGEAETSTYDVADFKGEKAQSEWTYPTETGKVFAGWFADAEYTTPFTATTGDAYAKFVDAEIMTVKKQFNTGATKADDTVNIRFLTAIKDTKLASVSFNVALAAQGKNWKMTETTAYSSVLEEAGGVAVATDASSVFGSDATYFVVHTLNGIPNAVFGNEFTAAVSWVTLDGTVVTGETSTFSIDGDETLPDGTEDETPETENWTVVDNLSQVTGTGFINNGCSLDREQESSGIVTLKTNDSSVDNQILLQFANAAQNISAFEISATVTAGTGRRGVGFKTPDGYLFFNVVENGGENGAGYVEFNVSNGSKTSQAYQALDEAAEAVVTGTEAYTLKLVATDLTGEATDRVTFYVNDIAVYTYTDASGWDLTEKVLPAIGVRGGNASATFTNYTYRVQYEDDTCEHTGGTATCKIQATCTACGQPYGDLNPENHVGDIEVRDAKEATGTEAGYTGDTYCLDCEKMIKAGETIPVMNTWTTVSGYTTVNGFINVNGTVDRDNETSSSVTFSTSEGSADNQLLCQFADAAANVKAFEISTTVQPDATGRRGVGFKTPDGYLFFNVVDNGGANGAGYVEFNVSNGSKTSQAYQALDEAAEAVITGTEPYTLKIVAENLTGTSADTITLYVNDIAVYTYTNTLGWDLTVKVLPAIGVRGSGASATFTNYTYRVQYEE